jgi:hypothetical protein
MEKKTEKEIEEEVNQRLREIELFEKEAQEDRLTYSCLSKEELVKKIRGESSKSPYIYAIAWWGGPMNPGDPGYCSVGIANPDTNYYDRMFVTIFFGLANLFDEISQGYISRDTRWVELSTRFNLAAGANTNKTFYYTTPNDVPLTTYIGNVVLWKGGSFNQGSYLDRALFWVKLH